MSIIARIEHPILKQIFTIENSQTTPVQPVLSLRLGNRHIAYSITNGNGEELFQLGYFSTAEDDNTAFATLLEQVPSLKDSFFQVQVSYDYTTNTMVPFRNFPAEEAGTILKALFGPNGNESVVTETITEWQLHNVYAVPSEVLKQVQLQFPSARSRNQFSLGISQLNASSETGMMIVEFRQDDFTVLLGRSGKLLLAQTYGYSTPEDVLYYLLKICDQFRLTQQDIEIRLSGLIDKDSALYKELNQYFLHLEFREGNWQGSDFPAHFFTSLNDLARCAS